MTLCFEWAGLFLLRDVLPGFHNDGAAPQGRMSENMPAVPLAALPCCTKVAGGFGMGSSKNYCMDMQCAHTLP